VAAVESNPFAILTFIAAPAILTNAASVLALGTSTRFGRNVDRMRALIKLLEGESAGSESAEFYRTLMALMERRSELLVRAMSLFYFSVGCFAAGSLTSLVGGILATTMEHPYALRAVLFVAMLAGAGGLGGLILGGSLLVRETRLALGTIRDEAEFYRARLGG
jgi:hypothetical protein